MKGYTSTRFFIFLMIATILFCAGCEKPNKKVTSTSDQVESSNSVEWLSHGNGDFEQRFSSLTQINTNNVESLGLAWEADMDSLRGLEATPIVADGVMYVTSTWSRVIALNAVTGDVLWQYDPKVEKSWAKRLCCDVVNRGVALHAGKIYFGTLDGYLIALDAKNGELVWKVDTLISRDMWYSITGAPRVIKGKVIIGNGGAEYWVRGYFSAFDANTGELDWRFYTVPASKDGPHEHQELVHAATTWADDSNWIGGGGTAWDSIAYDPSLNTLYVGTGNGAPWQRNQRSPGGGDNLFVASILALDPDNGKLKWHYQVTPGDNWDYTATQHMILADLKIDGLDKKVLMQAPKNGFFYVLDRVSGELISAEKFVYVNWASHIDKETGRPVETGLGDYEDRPAYVFPSPAGAHNWHPMSYSSQTGLVYFSARDVGWVFNKAEDKWFTYGVDNLESMTGDQQLPDTKGYLKAWDPVSQKLVWQLESDLIWNGGALSTAGNLVFYGNGAGEFMAINATSGAVLKNIMLGTGVIAPPISYQIEGVQYIAVMAGWGGPAFNTMQGGEAAMRYSNAGRLLVFKLNGDAVKLPTTKPGRGDILKQPDIRADAETVEKGRMLYYINCAACHGVYGSVPLLPDLRYLSHQKHKIFNEIVRDGALEPLGMPGFAEQLSKEDAFAVQAYIIQSANDAIAASSAN